MTSLDDAIPALVVYYEKTPPQWKRESATRYRNLTQFGLLRVEQDQPGQWLAYRNDNYPLLRNGQPAIFATSEEPPSYHHYPNSETIYDGFAFLPDEDPWWSYPHRVAVRTRGAASHASVEVITSVERRRRWSRVDKIGAMIPVLAAPAKNSRNAAAKPYEPTRRHHSMAFTGCIQLLRTLAVIPWPTRATTPAPCKPTSATATFSIPSGTPSNHQCGSRISGANRNYENRIYWPCHGVNLRTKLGSVF